MKNTRLTMDIYQIANQSYKPWFLGQGPYSGWNEIREDVVGAIEFYNARGTHRDGPLNPSNLLDILPAGVWHYFSERLGDLSGSVIISVLQSEGIRLDLNGYSQEEYCTKMIDLAKQKVPNPTDFTFDEVFGINN